ncbi:MAG: hypothetical protein L7U68_02855 [Flavobacteriaceae bacterium]|nr:hypothetical protein [Flavobacteriaceae bacterium]
MKRHFVLFSVVYMCSFSLWGQNENKPLQRKIEVDPASKSLLKIPEKNPLPNFLQKDFLSKTPDVNTPSKGFEKDIQMGFKEDFIDPGQEYLERLQTPEAEKNPGNFKVDQYLGDFKSNAKSVRVVFRDHQHPDGDRVQVRLNDEIFYPNILLQESYKKLDVDLKTGFNKIDFVALNQGESGPNTAEVRVYDDQGNLMMANRWNLATGTKATFIVVKDE